MLITNLDHFRSIDATENVTGGSRANGLLALTISRGKLSLKLDDTILLERPIEMPSTISLSFENTSLIATSNIVQTANGVTTSSISIALGASGSVPTPPPSRSLTYPRFI
jgi:hypothetical protein